MVATKCRCLHQCPDGARSGVCYLQPGGYCFAHAEVITTADSGGALSYEVTRGCFPADIEGLLQCKGAHSEHWAPKNISCCQGEDFCNDHLFPTIDGGVIKELSQSLRSAELASSSSSSSAALSVLVTPATVFLLSALLSFFVFLVIALLLYRHRNRTHHQQKKLLSEKGKLEEMGEDTEHHSTEFDEGQQHFGNVHYSKLSTSQRLMKMLSGKPSSPSTRATPPLMSRGAGRVSNFLRRTTEGVVEAVVVVGGGGGVGTGMISSCTSSPSDSSINIKYSPLQNSASNASSKTSTMTSNGTTSTALTSITTSNDQSSPSTQTQEKLPEVPKLLVQKRLFNDIDLGERLSGLEESSGSFGAAAIYKGRFNEADVAVKIYPFREATAYSREIAIYRKVLLMRHENVLQCLGADQVKGRTDDATTTTTTTKCSSPFDYSGLWLVTEYHRNGSLYEYLSNKRVGKGSAAQKLSLPRLLSLMRSLVSGLEYLHRETIGTLAGKVAIAHRDLQSRRSVLVREDGASCVIADFSLAATSADCYQSIGGLLKGRREKSRVNRRRRRLEAVGSTRYLAPELLVSAMAAAEGGDDHHFPRAHLEAYKRADIYALGLIFWEMYRLLDLSAEGDDGQEEEEPLKYKLPFQEELEIEEEEEEDGEKLSLLEKMHRLVVNEKRRPLLEMHYSSNEQEEDTWTAAIRTLIGECWTETPSARLTALNIKKKLMNLEKDWQECHTRTGTD